MLWNPDCISRFCDGGVRLGPNVLPDNVGGRKGEKQAGMKDKRMKTGGCVHVDAEYGGQVRVCIALDKKRGAKSLRLRGLFLTLSYILNHWIKIV